MKNATDLNLTNGNSKFKQNVVFFHYFNNNNYLKSKLTILTT